MKDRSNSITVKTSTNKKFTASHENFPEIVATGDTYLNAVFTLADMLAIHTSKGENNAKKDA